MTLQQWQQHVKTVDTLANPEQGYFLKLIEEVGELAEAIRQNQSVQPTLETLKGRIAEELVDVLYYTLALANQHGIDLNQAFELKEQLNKIKYQR